jgi:hypothetical protein
VDPVVLPAHRRVTLHWHVCSFNGRRVYEVWDVPSGRRVLRTYSRIAAGARRNRMIAEYHRLDDARRQNK